MPPLTATELAGRKTDTFAEHSNELIEKEVFLSDDSLSRLRTYACGTVLLGIRVIPNQMRPHTNEQLQVLCTDTHPAFIIRLPVT